MHEPLGKHVLVPKFPWSWHMDLLACRVDPAAVYVIREAKVRVGQRSRCQCGMIRPRKLHEERDRLGGGASLIGRRAVQIHDLLGRVRTHPHQEGVRHVRQGVRLQVWPQLRDPVVSEACLAFVLLDTLVAGSVLCDLLPKVDVGRRAPAYATHAAEAVFEILLDLQVLRQVTPRVDGTARDGRPVTKVPRDVVDGIVVAQKAQRRSAAAAQLPRAVWVLARDLDAPTLGELGRMGVVVHGVDRKEHADAHGLAAHGRIGQVLQHAPEHRGLRRVGKREPAVVVEAVGVAVDVEAACDADGE
eukprot:5176257-Prymnesium_polylepis.1